MQSKLAYLTALTVLLILQAYAQSVSASTSFTLQVASFPDGAQADEFIAKLKQGGEQPVWGTVELPGRGIWTRIFIGSFQTVEAARRYGDGLIKRGLIAEFLIKTARETEMLSRPRLIVSDRAQVGRYSNKPAVSSAISKTVAPTVVDRKNDSLTPMRADQSSQYLVVNKKGKGAKSQRALVMNGFIPSSAVVTLPQAGKLKLEYAPKLDATLIPRADPVQLAFRLIISGTRPGPFLHKQPGGLWVSGDVLEALTRLRWMLGEADAALIRIDENGQVKLDKELLAKAAGVGHASSVDNPLKVVDYIYSNEGLLLLVQLTEGTHRYRLHLGRQVETWGAEIEVNGSINLDNNYDSRINPYRRLGKKLDSERPPEGFDSMVALNPVARWFNLRANTEVPVGNITFHELAEAHAKLELELDYLGQGARPGAHNIALERERRLKAQRPRDVVMTIGSNRVLRSEEEIKQFYSQSGIGVSSPR